MAHAGTHSVSEKASGQKLRTVRDRLRCGANAFRSMDNAFCLRREPMMCFFIEHSALLLLLRQWLVTSGLFASASICFKKSATFSLSGNRQNSRARQLSNSTSRCCVISSSVNDYLLLKSFPLQQATALSSV